MIPPMPTLIDTHCHLTHGRLRGDLPGVLRRARQAGLVAMICAAGDLDEARSALDLAHSEADVYCLAGVHPHEAKDAPGDYQARIEQLAADPKNVAVGEIGLDYHYDFSPRQAQRRVFAEQLDLARRLGRRVVVHTREALEDTLAIIRASGIDAQRLVFHSCTEDSAGVRRLLDTGAMVSFSGIVTFAGTDYLRQAARLVPDERLLIETDSPYLSPEPVRKMKTNEPANVAHVCVCLASVRGVTPEAQAELPTANARRFFALPDHPPRT